MMKYFKYWILMPVIIIASCHNKQDISNAIKVYEQWRENETQKGVFVAECDTTIDVFLNNTFRVPSFYDKGEELNIDSTVIDVNNDQVKDLFLKVYYEQCGAMDGYYNNPPPSNLIIIYNEGKGFVVDNSMLTKLKNNIDNFIDKEIQPNNYRVYVDSLFLKGTNVFFAGSFIAWKEDDPMCCPRINTDYVCLYPTSNDNGYINYSVSIQLGDNEKTITYRRVIEKLDRAL